MIAFPSPAHGLRRAACTLVEVTLAVGITALGLVSLLTLIPSGLERFQGAMNTSIASQIFQRLANDARQADFNSFIEGHTSPFVKPFRYFDDQGSELPSSSKAGAVYQARMLVMPSTSLPSAMANPDMATVVVQIVSLAGNIPAESFLGIDPLTQLLKSKGVIRPFTFSTVIAKVTS